MNIENLLEQETDFSPIFSAEYFSSAPYVFDLASADSIFKDQPLSEQFSITATLLRQANTKLGIGLYAEKRDLYHHRRLFVKDKVRDIHLGFDLTVPEGILIFPHFRRHSLLRTHAAISN
jgi:hypothetical protein